MRPGQSTTLGWVVRRKLMHPTSTPPFPPRKRGQFDYLGVVSCSWAYLTISLEPLHSTVIAEVLSGKGVGVGPWDREPGPYTAVMKRISTIEEHG